MKVFGSMFLESMVSNEVTSVDNWNWVPANNDINRIYNAAKTSSNTSTYADETDNYSDEDNGQNNSMLVS